MAEQLGEGVPGSVVRATDEWVEVHAERLVDVLRWLHDSDELDAVQLSSCTAVDWHDRFEVVYHLQSFDRNHQIVLKVAIADREAPSVPSATAVYKGAVLQEREVYDLMGIRFDGHPDLRRVFLWDGFPGFPLRKDFMGMPGHTSGLRRFPFEDPDDPDRVINPIGVRRAPGGAPSGDAS